MEPKNLGERIKFLRKELGLTQEEFGAKIGVKGNTVTGYERGTRIPSDSVINYACLIFNVNQAWLRTGEGDVFLDGADAFNVASLPKRIWLDYDCNNVEMEFLNAYFSLKKTDRNAFCKLLHKMFPQSVPEPQDTDSLVDDDLDYQEAPPIEAVPVEPALVDILSELQTLKAQNQELRTRLEAIEKEDAEAERERLAKAKKKTF